ncbi:MAG: serine--tRNA ligase [Devosia sp.]|nr:serine--tRNA ligase [Devosia sp.]
MLDINWIKANPEAFDRALSGRKSVPFRSAELIALDDQRRMVIASVEEAQAKRNTLSKQIGQAKAQKDEAKAQALMEEVAHLKDLVQNGEAARKDAEDKLRNALSIIPNLPLDEVPVGDDESDNVEYFGPNGSPETAAKLRPPKPSFSFAPKEHFETGEALGMMDFEVAAKLSGSRFVVLKSQLARLERAIGQFMLDLHVDEHGYTEVLPPLLVRDDALYGTNQLPKFEEDLFFVPHGDGRLALIPTAEVPLTNMVRESILSADQLPMRLTALTPCFRSEAGSAGRDTRGMLRQHQFNKVEMVSITAPEKSGDEHEKMVSDAEDVLKRLGLHYRVMTLSTGDMGFGAQKTYDLEAWLPGQDTYREISSVSVCGDFQARRMDARYRDADGKVRHVHTLNGSGVAVGRALIAVMENYQQEDGSVAIPDVLQPYMKGLKTIGAKS